MVQSKQEPMSNELCKCGKVGRRSCPNDERCSMPNNYTHLPIEVIKEIKSDAERIYYTDPTDKTSVLKRNQARKMGYISGATEYATKLHELQGAFKKSEAFAVEVMKDCTEAKKLLDEVLRQDEVYGDALPIETINKIKSFLYGE
jgi:hypothetical protein